MRLFSVFFCRNVFFRLTSDIPVVCLVIVLISYRFIDGFLLQNDNSPVFRLRRAPGQELHRGRGLVDRAALRLQAAHREPSQSPL